VGESVAAPAKYFENNINQGTALMSSLVNLGVRRVVFSSSCATYGEPQETPIHEGCRQWPTNPYGWSKLFMERLLDSYDTAYGLRFAALRYFNAAGATTRLGEHHDPETHLIPNVLSAAMGDQEEVTIFGDDYPTPDGTAVRDYIHVADLVDAHVRALDYLRQGGHSEYLNLGTGCGYSVLQVIQCAEKVTGRSISYRVAARRPGDPARLVADPSRANTILGWTPSRSDLHTIVRSAWDWRLRHPHGYSADLSPNLTLFEQIGR
jgi:UDP-glucose 4-epimerase